MFRALHLAIANLIILDAPDILYKREHNISLSLSLYVSEIPFFF